MRKPERIEPILKEIEKYWKKNPDLRLGQIIANCVRAFDGRVNCDPFYIEDNDLLNGLSVLQGKIDRLKYCEELDCVLPYSPVYKIEFVDRKTDSMDSKLGGEFFWPDDNPPEKMLFLAQINLSDLPNNLTGLLQFFIEDNDTYGLFNKDGNGYKVVYHKDITNGKSFTNKEDDYLIRKPCALDFILSEEPMSCGDYRFENHKEYDVMLEDAELYRKFSGAGSKMLGYPFVTQFDPRKDDKYDTLLLQLDSDDTHLMWGDCGVCNFFINHGALNKLDFSDILYNWDCY